jgi:hypothetical protein
LIEPVDLLLLNVRAPLADAVSATVCRRWREAADLWLEACQEPVYRPLSARCGLEATLKAGLYDLAQYFHAVLEDAPALPDFLGDPWARSLRVRRDRARVHAAQAAESRPHPASPSPRRLVELRLYGDAIREIFRQGLLGTNHGAAILLLAECYSRLGDHEALVALDRSHRLHLAGGGVRDMLVDARAALARESLGPVAHAADFARRHPAGHLLTPFLESPRSAYARHG